MNNNTHSDTFVVQVNRRSGENWYGSIRSANDGSQKRFQNVQELLESMNKSLNGSNNSL